MHHLIIQVQLVPWMGHSLLQQYRHLRKRRAAVVARPVVLTQENIPAIFDNNRTFYTKLVGERTAELDEVTYGTMISVLPRFASRNQIELLLNIEDGNEINSDKTNVDDLPQVGRTLISTIARASREKSFDWWIYTRYEYL